VEVSKYGQQIVQKFLGYQRAMKARDPHHRVVVDPIMESMHGDSVRELAQAVSGEQLAATWGAPADLRSLNVLELWRAAEAHLQEPLGGAGGLGIIGGAIARTAAVHGERDNFGLVQISLLHTSRRSQGFTGNRQTLEFYEVDPIKSPHYHFIGEIVSTTLYGEERLTEVWVFTGHNNNDRSLLSLRLRLPEITGIIYPRFDSQANLDQMQVLGQGGFRLAQFLGILGTEEAQLADIVIGHDGHTAMFHFNLFLWFYQKLGNVSAAIEATRKLCVTTIHAPQTGTVPRTSGKMIRAHYDEEADRLWGSFGEQHGQLTNALFAEICLSDRVGGVSPLHNMVTAAEEKAEQRGFANGAPQLLPSYIEARRLELFPDTIAPEEWLGPATAWTLDQHYPFWRAEPHRMIELEVLDNLVGNHPFRRDLVDAFGVQREQLLTLLNDAFPRKFKVEIPPNAIVFASLRRATAYKIRLITDFLAGYKIMDSVAKELGRPIVYLFGGIAHQEDGPALDHLGHLLGRVEEINQNTSGLRADFLIDYGRERAGWIFPGLAQNGCWVSCTNPLDNRSQGTEAFGPSIIKAALNGVWIMGPDDGGAGCLNLQGIPTVSIYGPTTFVGEQHSLHNDLWGNASLVNLSRVLLANGFVGAFRRMAGVIHQDLLRLEAGRGLQAPGLSPKIEAIAQTVARYNGRVLLDSYLSPTRA
jgi:hypothetical protein